MGFVPTMGALHDGHASLIARSKEENKFTVVTIFVNPTQFDDPTDIEKYPRTETRDIELLQSLGVDAVLCPSFHELYPDGYMYRVTENDLSHDLCGKSRPGHFDGVLSVVLKLFGLVKPARAYFGEKDFQQLKLIEGMVRAFFLDVEICACPTVREADGLAMSSRNMRLSPIARETAAVFPKLLQCEKNIGDLRAKLVEHGFEVDYLEEHNERRFGAVIIDGVRLIDNVKI